MVYAIMHLLDATKQMIIIRINMYIEILQNKSYINLICKLYFLKMLTFAIYWNIS